MRSFPKPIVLGALICLFVTGCGDSGETPESDSQAEADSTGPVEKITGDAKPIDLSHVPFDATSVLVAFPQRILEQLDSEDTDVVAMLTDAIDQIGMDPKNAIQITGVSVGPTAKSQSYGVALHLDQPQDPQPILQRFHAGPKKESDGIEYWTSLTQPGTAIAFPKPTTILVGAETAVLTMHAVEEPSGLLVDRLTEDGVRYDVFVAIDRESDAMRQLDPATELPKEFRSFSKILDDLWGNSSEITVGAAFAPKFGIDATFVATDAEELPTLEKASKGIAAVFGLAAPLFKSNFMKANKDSGKRPSELTEDFNEFREFFKQARTEVNEDSVLLAFRAETDAKQYVSTMLPMFGGGGRSRDGFEDNLGKIKSAFEVSIRETKKTPAPAIRAEDGTPLLSWRVAILPMLGYDELFRAFRLDEPWDSEHNQKLLEMIPSVYADPTGSTAVGETRIQGLVGEGTVFSVGEGVPVDDLMDPVEWTVLLVETSAKAAKPWTAPQDLEFDPAAPLANLGSGKKFHALFANGDVREFETARKKKQAENGERPFGRKEDPPLEGTEFSKMATYAGSETVRYGQEEASQ